MPTRKGGGSRGRAELGATPAVRRAAGPQGWTGFEIAFTPWMPSARQIRFLRSRLGASQPSRASSSSIARTAGGRGPAVDRWLTRSSDLLTLPAAVASGGATAIGHCRGGAASAIASSEACPRGASNGRAAWAFGDQKMLALELARQARPQSLNSAWHRRRALPERVPASAFLQGI